MLSFHLLAALPLLVCVSGQAKHTLLPRTTSTNETSCASGDKGCGTVCIPDTYTCCPDLGGGCPSTSVCAIGDNGVYGCCGKGEYCDGDGGSEYIDDNGSSSTSSSTSSTGAATKTGDSTSGAKAAAGFGQLEAVVVVAVVAASLVAVL